MTVDELTDYGMERLDDEAIRQFLATHSLGVLGLPTDSTPYLLPLSYGFDGESRLYFVYVTGTDSTKASLSDRADDASFLVYSAETMFHWQSVLITGTIHPLSTTDYEDLTEDQTPTWRPELFETASTDETTDIYTLEIDDWSGLRHSGTPPAYTERSSRDESA
ncbi:pyridoxamine 5'-phosphate oxidase family protein [Natronolimnobius sp. AArcel1]|uniref:pyridoxamine 5'-phosphate oxidase family protein n=1 Tax=Natronolimnobius sp. AArcel1 TaxID=1679093 RepID=UPI0013EAC6BF|nr:pyridoxamine 5'-phosphate oxidase family protein [Natronolimnobius sp. AArcel1]NGM69147.1 pyridoxamine 5'-phosphate oxidase family protein [Natronolimnobius sp. AArcel1]